MIEQLGHDLLISSLRALAWTSVSFVVGIALGYICYYSVILRRLLMPPVNFLRHISAFCWLPVIIIIWGIGELSVGIVLLFAMLFNAIVISCGVFGRIRQDLLDTAALDGAGDRAILSKIELPLAIPDLIELYRILWSVAWTAIIAAEMLGVSSGMGYRLLDFRYLLEYRAMSGYILVIGTVGVLTDYLLQRLVRFSKAKLFE
jgi:ABC-type nitrate/sulfonate/bicarbonate transport system permease component